MLNYEEDFMTQIRRNHKELVKELKEFRENNLSKDDKDHQNNRDTL